MSAPTTQPALDNYGTIAVHDPAALRVREALLALLRAWEEMHELPRSIPTRAERLGEFKKEGHHNRG